MRSGAPTPSPAAFMWIARPAGFALIAAILALPAAAARALEPFTHAACGGLTGDRREISGVREGIERASRRGGQC